MAVVTDLCMCCSREQKIYSSKGGPNVAEPIRRAVVVENWDSELEACIILFAQTLGPTSLIKWTWPCDLSVSEDPAPVACVLRLRQSQ